MTAQGTTTADFDVVVVGGGHNTLTAAGYLAKAGYRVLVLEKNDYIGGGIVSQELTAPGFIHELHAVVMFLIMSNPMMRYDELELFARHGLEFVGIEDDRPFFSSAFDDGAVVSTYFDVDRTCAEIARYSSRDAERYRQLTVENGGLINLIIRAMFTPPLPLGGMLKLLSDSTSGQRLTRMFFSSGFDIIDRNFENTYIRCHLYKWLSENLTSPDEVGTGLIMLMLLGMGHVIRPGFFRGGNQTLCHALRSQIESCGGEVRTGAEVVKFNVASGTIRSVGLADGETVGAREAVVAATPPWDLHRFIDGLDRSTLGDVDGLNPSSFTVFLTHYALHEAPRYKAGGAIDRSLVTECMVPDLETFRRCYDEFKYGGLPQIFSGHAVCTTLLDASRAPQDKHSLYYYHYVPLIPRGRRFEEWQDIKDDFADWMLEGLRRYTTNMDAANIIARNVESPYEMSQHSPSFRNGECFGIAMTPRQFMGERPTPQLAQYRVPGIEGLYLCGPAQHPGGGGIGGGRPVAMRILMDRGVDLKKAFPAL